MGARIAMVALMVLVLAQSARAEPRSPCTLPRRVEFSSWLRLGGGVERFSPTAHNGVFETALGGEAMVATNNEGAFRIGPWAQVATTNFNTIIPTGGVEVLWAIDAVHGPLPWWSTGASLDKQWATTLRLGAGWRWGFSRPIGGEPLSEATLTFGLRTHHPRRATMTASGQCTYYGIEQLWGVREVPDEPRATWYSWGIRAFISARASLRTLQDFQVVAGLEIEPMTLFFTPSIISTALSPEPDPV